MRLNSNGLVNSATYTTGFRLGAADVWQNSANGPQKHTRPTLRGPFPRCTDTLGTLRSESVFNALGPISAIFDASCTHAVRSAKTPLSAKPKLCSPRFFSKLRVPGHENPESGCRDPGTSSLSPVLRICLGLLARDAACPQIACGRLSGTWELARVGQRRTTHKQPDTWRMRGPH